MNSTQNTTIKNIALHTLQLQADAINGLQPFINEQLEQAVALILQCNGRVIVSGIGKSAIVAQKIVATLNSTGTPALFMHAADAIHGDLGMVQPQDVVVMVSKSGDSPEIKVLLPLIKNFGNSIIAIVGNLQSYLAANCSFVLNTTVAKEACPHNLAPTTSTTAQMVMGDVLAICLMEAKTFTATDFAKYHPGGMLGKKMYLKVADLILQHQKPLVVQNDTIKKTIIEISKNRLGATAVVDANNKIKGIITDGDVRRMFEKYNDFSTLVAADIMSVTPKCIDSSELAMQALQMMRVNNISQLLVLNKNNYLGILHIQDLMREGII